MKLFILIIVFFFIQSMDAQDLSSYIEQHAQTSDLPTLKLDLSNSNILESDLIFFGFIHGCATPQVVDFKLLEYFVTQQGLKYYAPEVDYSQAYFLNQYLQKEEEEILDFIVYFYAKRVPQDASVQFKEKWKKIYQLNKSLAADQKISIIGTDFPSSDVRIAITHLAHLIGDNKTGDKMLDSLKLYKNLAVKDIRIWSGKPAMELIKKHGGYTMDYVHPVDSKWNFSNRFFNYYLANQDSVLSILKQFDINAADIFNERAKKREDHIFENFKHKIIPLIKQGKQVYANFGYAHIHQAQIYNRCFLACKVKDEFPSIKVNSILGLLAKSKALKHWKVKKGTKFTTDRGLVFNKMEIKGYKKSASYDGHGLFEKLVGIKSLIRAGGDKEILLLNLDKPNSPFGKTPYLVDYKIGGKHIDIDPKSNTLQYFQYIIFMQDSEANIPLNYQKE